MPLESYSVDSFFREKITHEHSTSIVFTERYIQKMLYIVKSALDTACALKYTHKYHRINGYIMWSERMMMMLLPLPLLLLLLLLLLLPPLCCTSDGEHSSFATHFSFNTPFSERQLCVAVQPPQKYFFFSSLPKHRINHLSSSMFFSWKKRHRQHGITNH